jgi:archaetidylinositol phosphate synthase
MRDSRLRLKTIFRPIIDPVAALMIRIKLTANEVTAIGALMATLTPFLMASGEYIAFGLMVFLVGFMDGVDGSIARISKTATRWGGFLDSLLDRYGDSLILISYLFLPATAPLGETVVVFVQFRLWICFSVIGFLMVSYTRAKGEAIGATGVDAGFAARSERLLMLSITAILGVLNEYFLIYGLIVVGILANLTALYRIDRTAASLRKGEMPHREPPESAKNRKTNR